MFALLKVAADCRWVDTGRYVTFVEISADIDMSLHLEERIAGHKLMQDTARQMDFEWRAIRDRH